MTKLSGEEQEQVVLEFLKWLQEQGVVLQVWRDGWTNAEPRYLNQWGWPTSMAYSTSPSGSLVSNRDNPDFKEIAAGWHAWTLWPEEIAMNYRRRQEDRREQSANVDNTD